MGEMGLLIRTLPRSNQSLGPSVHYESVSYRTGTSLRVDSTKVSPSTSNVIFSTLRRSSPNSSPSICRTFCEDCERNDHRTEIHILFFQLSGNDSLRRRPGTSSKTSCGSKRTRLGPGRRYQRAGYSALKMQMDGRLDPIAPAPSRPPCYAFNDSTTLSPSLFSHTRPPCAVTLAHASTPVARLTLLPCHTHVSHVPSYTSPVAVVSVNPVSLSDFAPYAHPSAHARVPHITVTIILSFTRHLIPLPGSSLVSPAKLVPSSNNSNRHTFWPLDRRKTSDRRSFTPKSLNAEVP
ncbi:hypothetical protein OF83DRAFT_48622 [Amylostereum chailletii]|nr:hypothetical protein OF83DRAFT_48622 [Amylostereum chailletii]